MQQMNAPEWVSVRISSVAVVQLELSTENRHCQDDSNNTNRSADLARVADQVQSSRCDRLTCLMILTQFCQYEHRSCPTARVEYKKPTTHVKMTRNGRSRGNAFSQ
eukprot:2863321-Pyramimonas_sp.AAC.1